MTANSGPAQHRSQKARGRIIKALPAVAAVTIAGLTAHAVPAQAAPSQPGVTNPQGSQPGVTSTPDTTATPPPPAPTQERQFLPLVQPSPRVQQSEWRSYDDYQSGNQQSSYQTTYYEQTPTPQATPQAAPTEAPPVLQAAPPPVPTVQRTVIAPIDAPDGYILAGSQLVPYDPAVVDPNLVEQFNNSAAGLQADGGNFLVDNGFADAPQADRIAAGTATGIIAGGATGFAASLLPAAVITGTGAAIGAGLGIAATTGTGAIVWGGPVGWIFIPGAAALAGAGIGAALSVPIVLGLTATGAGIGALLGGTVLGGEQQIIEEPAPAPIVPPAAASVPTLSPDTTQSVLFEVPGDVRGAIVADPVGAQVVEALDTAVQDGAPIVEQAVSDPSVWTEPAFEAVQGFTSTALEQPAVTETVAAVATAAAPIVDQANAALAGLQANLLPA